jgi:hypothetical protein
MDTHQVAIAVLLLASASSGHGQVPQGKLPAYSNVLEEGLMNQLDTMRVPRGRVQIIDAMGSQFETDNPGQLKFRYQYLTFLKKAQKDGLVTLTEERQSDLQTTGQHGSDFLRSLAH